MGYIDKFLKVISTFLFFLLISFPLSSSGSIEHLLITEVQIEGDKASYDFIEIFNPSSIQKDISGYQLRKRTKNGKESSLGTFPEGSLIPAKGYFLWACSKDGYDKIIQADISFKSYYLSQDNSIALLDKDKNIIDSLAWGSDQRNPFVEDSAFPENPGKNQSLERKISSQGDYLDTNNNAADFKLNQNPSPGQASSPDSQKLPPAQTSPEPSILPTPSPTPTESPSPNLPPVAVAGDDIIALVGTEINFDGSKSFDPEGEQLVYLWNFGDGLTSTKVKETHIFQYPGTYIVSLTVSDGKNSKTDTLKASIFVNSLVISEFIPNPKGKDDENEWIELYNNSDQTIEISGWQLKSGNKTFIFPEKSFVLARQFLVLPASISKITLGNKAGTLELYYPNGVIAQKIEYQEAKENWSIARLPLFDAANYGGQTKIEEKYLWTNNPTPGFPNKESSNLPDDKNFPTPEKIFSDTTSLEYIVESPLKSPIPKIQTTPEITPEITPESEKKAQITKEEVSLSASAEEQASKTGINLWLILASLITFSSLAGWGLIKIKNK